MEFMRDGLFDLHPDPIWVCEPATLRLLAVNSAAIARFGYAQEDFLAMTLEDLRPEEDRPSIRPAVPAMIGEIAEGGIWRLLTRQGAIVHADMRWRRVTFEGLDAVLASIRDVTRLVELRHEQSRPLAESEASRATREETARLHHVLFETISREFLVLAPHDYVILAASDAYLDVTGLVRDDIVGKPLFDVFPDNPAEAEGLGKLRTSLERVRATGKADVMAFQRYPIPLPAAEGGGFEERFWSPINTPVHGAEGQIDYIFHRLEDVTSAVREHGLADFDAMERFSGSAARFELLVRSSELKAGNLRLLEHEANLRTATEKLGIGLWKLHIETGELTCSAEVYEIYGIAPSVFAHSFDGYMELVHPEDRAEMSATYAAFASSHRPDFHFTHRIRRGDDTCIHVQGVGERRTLGSDSVLIGVVQDVTARVAADTALADATQLLRFAGKAARLGGWKYTLETEELNWSPELADIHDLPAGTAPSLQQALAFYTPESEAKVTALFRSCLENGTPFDEVLDCVTATGRHIKVRALGGAACNEDGRPVAIQGALQDISELVAAQAESEQLATRLIDTLESIGDAFFTLDSSWRFTYVNARAEQVLGRMRTEVLGKVVWDEFPEARGSEFQAAFERVASSGETERVDEFYGPLQKWLQVHVHRALDGLAVYFTDATEERVRDVQLNLLATAIERIDDMVVITEAEPLDEPGPRIVYVNEAFVRRTGFSRDEVIGRSPRFLQGRNTPRAELDRIRAGLAQWRPSRTELINYTRTGEEIWLELDISPILGEGGAPTHFVAVERDVTERKQAQEAMRVSEERLQLLVGATKDVIWDWDFSDRRLWWSQGLQSLFGYDLATIEPDLEWWTNRIHPDDQDRVVKNLKAVVAGSGTVWMEEYRFAHADGHAVFVVDRGSVIRNDTGAAVRMIGSMEDVTERRALDEQLRQAQKLEAVGQLTGGVAHDFNNLLTVILGNAEMLAEQLSEDQQLRLLAEMTETAALRAAELTSKLLAFSRKQALEPKLVDVGRLLTGMEGMLRRTLSETIDIQMIRAGGLWLTEIDPGQLEVALLNLAVNARDAMPDGGRLTIETANSMLDDSYASAHHEVQRGQYVVVSVTDSGTGIPHDVLSKVFDPFFTTKEVGKGSGLGLSMVFGFVKQSLGHAKIYSEVGIGTTVKLYFPRSGNVEEGLDMIEEDLRTFGGQEHILVVEDDELVRSHVVRQLKELGYRVTEARHGPEAMEMLRQLSDIDLLFTDIVMPGGMTGRELALAAAALRPGLKVLYTSGYTENAIVHHGRLDHGVVLLHKPYRRRDLASKVRGVIDD